MKYRNIKRLLVKNGIPTWKLVKKLGCSRDHFYQLSHYDFKGKENKVQRALKSLLKGE